MVVVTMKVRTTVETVEKVIVLLETFDASTEQFLDDLPTPEKYSILAMAWVIGGYDDYDEALCDAEHQVSAQELTKHLMKMNSLPWNLKDAVRYGWEYFEFIHSDEEYEEDED